MGICALVEDFVRRSKSSRVGWRILGFSIRFGFVVGREFWGSGEMTLLGGDGGGGGGGGGRGWYWEVEGI